MRKQDIKADGQTVYAYAKEWDWNGRYVPRFAKPVVVTATGVTRSRGRTGRTGPVDGVAITFLDALGKPGAKTFVVRSAEIRELWTDYKAVADETERLMRETERLMRERHAARLAERRLLMDRLNTLFENVPAARRPFWAEDMIHDDGSYAEKGTMYLGELATLLDAVYAAGVTAGREQS